MTEPKYRFKMVDLHASIYPKIHEALTLLERDSGGMNRVDCPSGVLRVKLPTHWVPGLSIIENTLYQMTSDDLDLFCTGEQTELDEMTRRTSGHRLAHLFLDDYFGAWGFETWEVERFVEDTRRGSGHTRK